jgi:hypothetical protein
VKNVSHSPHLLVQEAPTITIPIVKDVVVQVAFYSTNGLVCHFNGLWPCLVDLHKWISNSWKPQLKEEAFIYPCEKGFFIVEFDLVEDKDLILNFGP